MSTHTCVGIILVSLGLNFGLIDTLAIIRPGHPDD